MDGSGWVQAPAKRDRSGRFAAGMSGNPAGKRKGTRNRATMMAMLLRVDESGAITRAIIDRALAGDMVAARFCLQQILPKKRGREIELDLPECHDLDGIVAAFGVTVAAMAVGEITPDEALTVSKVLDRRRRALEARARQEKRAATDQPSSVVPDASIVIAGPLHRHPGARRDDGYCREVETGLHYSCKNSESETPARAPAASGQPVEPPSRPALPEFGSACIPPVITRRGSRSVAPIGERNRPPPPQISVSTWANFARTTGQVGVPAAR
jgi:hypothetical protein